MFSRRAQWNAPLNRLTIERRRRHDLIDLTETNPTTVSIDLENDAVADALARGAHEAYEPNPRGIRSAREALAARLECDPTDLMFTASTSEAYSFLFKLLCNPGDEVLAATPSYPLFEHLAALESVVLRTFPLEFHRRWEILRGNIRMSANTRAIIVVNPNNPTGSFVERDEQREIASIGLPVIADEVFLDYPLDGSGASFHQGDTLTFTLGGLSKSAGLPHLKLAWIRVQGRDKTAALEALEMIADNYLSPATPVQSALPSLLEIASRNRRRIAARIEANLVHLKRETAATPAVTLLPVEGGWSAVLRVPRLQTDDDLALQLLDAGVVVQPGYFFDFDGDGYLVISLLPEQETFRRGVARIMETAGLKWQR
jgi:aspartate/methionine/tyrosine aminotransferase